MDTPVIIFSIFRKVILSILCLTVAFFKGMPNPINFALFENNEKKMKEIFTYICLTYMRDNEYLQFFWKLSFKAKKFFF